MTASQTKNSPAQAASTPKSRRRLGPLLVEFLVAVILLTILAVLIVPKFAQAAGNRQQLHLRNSLKELRTQIYVYRAEHNSIPPGYPKGDTSRLPTYDAFLAQMTQPSNAAGESSPVKTSQFKFGPYLTTIPVNPINGSAKVRLVTSTDTFPNRPMGDEGWVYQPSTATIAANVEGVDANGAAFFDY